MNDQVKKHLNELIDEASRLYPLHNDLATRAYLDRIIDLARMAKAEPAAAEDSKRTTTSAAEVQGQDTKNKTVMKSIKWPEGFSVEVEKNGRKLVGVINECGAYIEDETYPFRFFATVYEGNDLLFEISACARGLSFQRRILKSAMNEAVMILSHARRWRANRAAKKGGAKEAIG